jgi:hypothetical protein
MKCISSSGSILQRGHILFSTGSLMYIKLEDRYINHWNFFWFNDDNKHGGNKLRTYRKLKNSYKMEKFLHSDVDKFALSIKIHILHISRSLLLNMNLNF